MVVRKVDFPPFRYGDNVRVWIGLIANHSGAVMATIAMGPMVTRMMKAMTTAMAAIMVRKVGSQTFEREGLTFNNLGGVGRKG